MTHVAILNRFLILKSINGRLVPYSVRIINFKGEVFLSYNYMSGVSIIEADEPFFYHIFLFYLRNLGKEVTAHILLDFELIYFLKFFNFIKSHRLMDFLKLFLILFKPRISTIDPFLRVALCRGFGQLLLKRSRLKLLIRHLLILINGVILSDCLRRVSYFLKELVFYCKS